ncbi:hypothetical protein FTX61_09920 [Nitriliruptoraceae bacterium ZYF776]|nr:hypothetical protein [Profundirhabdus halotolerans]
MFDVHVSDYHEFFFVVAGEKTVSVSRFDPSDESYLEPEVSVFPKPYRWELEEDDDLAILQVWQVVGAQR